MLHWSGTIIRLKVTYSKLIRDRVPIRPVLEVPVAFLRLLAQPTFRQGENRNRNPSLLKITGTGENFITMVQG